MGVTLPNHPYAFFLCSGLPKAVHSHIPYKIPPICPLHAATHLKKQKNTRRREGAQTRPTKNPLKQKYPTKAQTSPQKTPKTLSKTVLDKRKEPESSPSSPPPPPPSPPPRLPPLTHAGPRSCATPSRRRRSFAQSFWELHRRLGEAYEAELARRRRRARAWPRRRRRCRRFVDATRETKEERTSFFSSSFFFFVWLSGGYGGMGV